MKLIFKFTLNAIQKQKKINLKTYDVNGGFNKNI